MDKYYIFRKLMDFLFEEADIVDADMNNYAGDITITGETVNQVIEITVSIKKKEANEDA